MRLTPDLFAANPDAKISIMEVGESRGRIVIADDYYANIEEVVAVAEALHYPKAPIHGNYPGERAAISIDMDPLLADMSELWGAPLEQFNAFQPVVFSQINTKGVKLNVAQRQPHLDPGISAMVYLNRPEQCSGGTGVYRHKLTGLERLPVSPTAEILELGLKLGLDANMFQTQEGYTSFQDTIIFNPLFSPRDNEYVNDGNDFWELLYLIEMKFNRLVIFDGRLFHSQHIAPGEFETQRRLNQMLYLKLKGR